MSRRPENYPYLSRVLGVVTVKVRLKQLSFSTYLETSRMTHNNYGRSDLQIYGGRNQTSLWNTSGCIRIFDKTCSPMSFS
ncbi:hypothetical protein [Vallitalea sp.]|uniref:hypothetical protein n=1 Tax=Vallitalea sp. TaxID=1882829 RepID=UPI0025CDB1C7|nr:hypothetical protein [Vallitalea sp.]MCT4688676.1 hypothetical protein [Vallitalea sp.]